MVVGSFIMKSCAREETRTAEFPTERLSGSRQEIGGKANKWNAQPATASKP
jgi:hypothetical protein